MQYVQIIQITFAGNDDFDTLGMIHGLKDSPIYDVKFKNVRFRLREA